MMMRKKLIVLAFFALLCAGPAAAQQQPVRTVIIFFDGLRPDYITPEGMPALHHFKQKGSYGRRHHSVFPTVTRVNSASYATGAYPKTHGLMGNTVYFPQVEKTAGLNTGDAKNLFRINEATGDSLLTATSLGEVLASRNMPLFVFSSGSSGQALLQNHKVGKGAIYNPELILPEGIREKVIAEIGTPPPYGKPNTARHAWMVDAFLRYGIGPDAPRVCALWFSDPDATAHAYGVGAPETVNALRIVDQQFSRVLDALDAAQGPGNTNIIISTDHGFVTNVGKESLVDLLVREGLKKDKDSQDVVVSEGAIYVQDHQEEKIKVIVAVLQEQHWVGPLFTRSSAPRSMKGWVEGTLSFEAIHWNHASRAADILMDENWTGDTNKFGYNGASYSKGIAGHGGASPFEISIPLLVSGPAFRAAFESNLPTSNVDITPTVLHILGLIIPAQMDGRILSELLRTPVPSAPMKARTEKVKTVAKTARGTYELELTSSILGKYRYVDFATVQRTVSVAGREK
jgi:predicted AlkP superfamily pyrophosphatase or phosphodiesterase